MSTIADRLRLLREEHGYSQAELAENMGVNRMTINNYENKRRIPDICFAANASTFFNVSLEYITGKSEFRNKEDMLYSVEKADALMKVIEKMPQTEAKQLMTSLLDILELSASHNLNLTVLTALSAVALEFKKLLVNYVNKNKNMKKTVKELRGQNVDEQLINKICREMATSIDEHFLDSANKLYATFLLCAKSTNIELLGLLEALYEK